MVEGKSDGRRRGVLVLSENLQRLRMQSGLSQKELAEKLHVARQTVSKWEKGTSDPSTHNLIALAELYGVDAATLIKSVERGDSRAAGASSES